MSSSPRLRGDQIERRRRWRSAGTSRPTGSARGCRSGPGRRAATARTRRARRRAGRERVVSPATISEFSDIELEFLDDEDVVEMLERARAGEEAGVGRDQRPVALEGGRELPQEGRRPTRPGSTARRGDASGRRCRDRSRAPRTDAQRGGAMAQRSAPHAPDDEDAEAQRDERSRSANIAVDSAEP